METAPDPYGFQTPEMIAKEYGGNKQKIATAMQNGIVDATVGTLAGMFIDRMRSAATQEMQPQQTVRDQVFAPPQPQGAPGGMPPQGSQVPMQQMAGQPAPPGPPAGPSSAQPGAGGGLQSLNAANTFAPQGGPQFASGGLVAFDKGGEVSEEELYRQALETGVIPSGLSKIDRENLRLTLEAMKDRDRRGSEALSRVMQTKLDIPAEQAAMRGAVFGDRFAKAKDGYEDSAAMRAIMGADIDIPAELAAMQGPPSASAPQGFGPRGTNLPSASAPPAMDPRFPSAQDGYHAIKAAAQSSSRPPVGPGGGSAGAGLAAISAPSGPAQPNVPQATDYDSMLAQSQQDIAGQLGLDTSKRDELMALLGQEGSEEALKKDKDQLLWETLARIGFGMADSSGSFLSALGGSANEALPSTISRMRELDDKKLETLRQQVEVENMTNAEKRDMFKMAAEQAGMKASLAESALDRALKVAKMDQDYALAKLSTSTQLKVASIYASQPSAFEKKYNLFAEAYGPGKAALEAMAANEANSRGGGGLSGNIATQIAAAQEGFGSQRPRIAGYSQFEPE